MTNQNAAVYPAHPPEPIMRLMNSLLPRLLRTPLAGGARKGGMPLYKYVANRALTAFENVLTGAKLSEYHTGYRAFSRRVLAALPLLENSDDFVFDARATPGLDGAAAIKDGSFEVAINDDEPVSG